MGMYDTVHAKCPECGTESGFQSKGGPCLLEDYDFDEAPPRVILGATGWVNTCINCGTKYEITVEVIPRIEKV